MMGSGILIVFLWWQTHLSAGTTTVRIADCSERLAVGDHIYTMAEWMRLHGMECHNKPVDQQKQVLRKMEHPCPPETCTPIPAGVYAPLQTPKHEAPLIDIEDDGTYYMGMGPFPKDWKFSHVLIDVDAHTITGNCAETKQPTPVTDPME